MRGTVVTAIKTDRSRKVRVPRSVYVLGATIFVLGTTEFVIAGLLPSWPPTCTCRCPAPGC